MSKYEFERTITDGPVAKEPQGIFLGTSVSTDSGNIMFVPNPAFDTIPVKNPMDSVCDVCGSDKIQQKYWVEVNSHKVMDSVDDYDDYPAYCPECGDNVDVLFRKDYVSEDDKLDVGDKVKIAETSEFYDENNPSNPRNEIGKVERIMEDVYPDMPYEVRWKGGTNNYARKDLIKVEPEF